MAGARAPWGNLVDLSLIERGHQTPSFEAVDRALRAAGHRLVSVPTVRDDAAAIAADIRFAVADRGEGTALRRFIQLNDNLSAEHGAARFALTISPPSRPAVVSGMPRSRRSSRITSSPSTCLPSTPVPPPAPEIG